jgi:hypothetical protein
MITKQQLDAVENYADKLFGKVGIDVEFTKHFLDRLNDARNKKDISTIELLALFRKSYKKYGKKIGGMSADAQAVLNDMKTDINMPFVITYDKNNKEFDLVAKTVMRKKGFKTPDQKLTVEKTKRAKYVPNEILDEDVADFMIALSDSAKTGKKTVGFGGNMYKVKLKNEATGDKAAYQKFFRSALKKFGVTEPDQLKGAKKKEFFDYVDKEWKSDDEEAGIEEAGSDYVIYHKAFYSATQAAADLAKKRGYEVDEDSWWNSVSIGPKKPSDGVTNSYHIELNKNNKKQKKMLHFQVYGMGKGRYELNAYVESYENQKGTEKEKIHENLKFEWSASAGDEEARKELIEKYGLRRIVSSVKPTQLKLNALNEEFGLDQNDELFFVN